MEVKKNNGKLEPLDISKVINVLQKAKASLSDNLIPNDEIRAVANMAINKAKAKYNMKAEPIPTTTIQSCVTKVLMERGLYSLAEKYIVGCYEKKLLRGQKELDRSILEVIDNKNADVATENSNKNSALLSTQRDYMAGDVSKDITRRLLLTDELCEAHDKGKIHIHDMDYMVQHENNCCLINLEDMLQNGTVINDVKIEKPRSLQTAATVMTQISACVASGQYGLI